jgi:hypothetical protein
MESRIKHYREKAAEVRRLAELTSEPDIHVEFLAIAAQYDRLADQLERQETRREIRVSAPARTGVNDNSPSAASFAPGRHGTR